MVSAGLSQIIKVSVENNRDALHTPAVEQLLRDQKIDVLIVMPGFGNDAGQRDNFSRHFLPSSSLTEQDIMWRTNLVPRWYL